MNETRLCTLYIGKDTHIGMLSMAKGYMFMFKDGSGNEMHFTNCQIWYDNGFHIEVVGEHTSPKLDLRESDA